MNKMQFRVLYRQFLFRIIDLEVLSGDAQGDASKLLGQFAALLVFVSVSLSLPAILGGMSRPSEDAAVGLVFAMITQHFLIATTMLAVGLVGVLSWDSTFPDKRDMLVLAPLPVSAPTMFLAKLAAVATTVGLTIMLLHSALGLIWPMAFAAQARPATLPALAFDPTPVPVAVRDIQTMMNHDLRQFTRDRIVPGRGSGMVIGVWKGGERSVFAYGAARPGSLFEIGSISKTFTGLLLARMVAQGKVRFDEPVRELLPPGTVTKPSGREITPLDLVTHRSGLPLMPTNFRPANNANPYADYGPSQLYQYLSKRGVERPLDVGYRYSNLGLGLLGQALAERAGRSYSELLRQEVTGPLGMNDTVVTLSSEQESRFLQAHDEKHRPVGHWDLDALAGAGAIRSTAADMITYMEANLRPHSHAALAGAIASSHQLRANAAGGVEIALAWTYNSDTGSYMHSGATAGFTAHAFFNPKEDCAAVVLINSGPNMMIPPDFIGEHIRQRLAGEPAVSLDTVVVPAGAGFFGVLRSFLAYWFTMLAAGAFSYGVVLLAQGLAAQLLSRRSFLRASGYLQVSAFCVIVGMYFLQPGFGGLSEPSTGSLLRIIQWLPSYWFLGLYQELNGSLHPAVAPWARRAWFGLAGVAGGTAAVYGLFYWRTLRQIIEEPDIVPGSHSLSWLPPFGGRVQTAIGQFSVRTLARSRQHRMILAFYLGVGLAFTGLLMKDPATKRQFTEGAATNPWSEASIPLWASSVIMMALAVVGTRVVFGFPLDLRANWIFRVIGVKPGQESRTASRRALLLLSVAPVWLIAALVCWGLWPSRETAVHLAVLGFVGMIAADLSLLGLRKIPFACSYLPGKSRFHMAFLGGIALLLLSLKAVLLEKEAQQESGSTVVMLALLIFLCAATRWVATWLLRRDQEELQFEEESDPAVQGLGLDRD